MNAFARDAWPLAREINRDTPHRLRRYTEA
jgi:hypothetical protein